ncbi:hypothetical protein [Aneurinibacillus aneurinilyticus]|uniref:hypothetical protein n=1 Tax=Aneurinibacillus aneurinilyticus TaxID=1391 RepID=UPI0023EF6CEC|nr:hypothetical protein [Aneurinibacillus aneurinilyticus]
MEIVVALARTKPIQFEDKTERLKEIRAAMKATNEIRLYVRYQCIYLFLEKAVIELRKFWILTLKPWAFIFGHTVRMA